MRLKLGFNEGGLGAAMDPVEAALVGTGGFALDFADTSRMWTTATKTTLVSTNGDTIGAIRSKWGSSEYDFLQPTAALRPAWQSPIAADFDLAATDHIDGSAAAALLQNKPAGFGCARVLIDTIATTMPVFSISTNSGASARFRLNIAIDGSLALTIRRVDAGSATTASSAAGVITTFAPRNRISRLRSTLNGSAMTSTSG